jgi:hypothetical protein
MFSISVYFLQLSLITPRCHLLSMMMFLQPIFYEERDLPNLRGYPTIEVQLFCLIAIIVFNCNCFV